MTVQFPPMVTNPVPIFFIVLAIILFAPVLLNKLKIPHIIGMIVAGVVIGPYGLNVIARDSSFEIFGQVGVIYLMFLAGLEIDMYHLKRNLSRGFVFGLLTLLIPLTMGVLTSVYLLHVDWLTSMLLGAMYASHTLISYPVVARYGITKSPAVLVAIVGTLVAVIGALLVIAVTVSIRREGTFAMGGLLRLLVDIVIYTIAVLYTYPRITRWFFKHYADKVTQYVFVLAMVFLSAWVAQLVGLEAVLGAFFAGLVLNRYIPSASALMNSIEFVGNAIFIPYFLIGVGMMINVRVIAGTDTLLMAAIMLVVSLLSKWLPAFIVEKKYSMGVPARNILFGLTTAHTAVALAVVSLGYRLHMFDEKVLNGTVLVILVTCALAPIITASAASKEKVRMLARAEEDDVPGRHHTSRRSTVIAVSNPLTIPSLVDLALLMRPINDPSSIIALHVRNDDSSRARVNGQAALDMAKKAAAAADVELDAVERFDLNTVAGMVNFMVEREATDVMVGLHHRASIIDSFLGSKIENLLNATNRMVVISRCFIPVNTISRIVVWVPLKAQYETGFRSWVCALANLTTQLGCRIIFCCDESLQPIIRALLYHDNYGVRCEFRTVNQPDDFVLYVRRVLPDDLLVVVGARVRSVSHSGSMAGMPDFIDKYFASQNLIFLYPEQFGENESQIMSFVDPMSTDINTRPSIISHRVRSGWRSLIRAKKKITHSLRRRR